MPEQPTCAERWGPALERTLADLREIDEGEQELFEYGLSFEWEPGKDGKYGYFCWCMSWGGPADYLHFYVNDNGRFLVCDQVDYQFQDWGDNETRTVHGADGKYLKDFFNRHWSDLAENDQEYCRDQRS